MTKWTWPGFRVTGAVRASRAGSEPAAWSYTGPPATRPPGPLHSALM